MRRLVMCLAVLLVPSLAPAAYQNPTVLSMERKADGGGHIIFQFAGNAGEPIVTRTYVIQSGSTLAGVRNWVDDTINELNLVQAAAVLPGLQQGQTVPRLARVNPARAAKELWNEKVARYGQLKDLGIAAAAADLAALKADIEATYQAGFVAP